MEDKLKTVVLGLSGFGRFLLEAANASGYFEITAVADTDTNLAGKIAEEFHCAAYDDYRQLITAMDSSLSRENRALLVAAGMHSCDEHLRMAIKKNFNILKLAPAARNFEEAAEMVRLSEDVGVQFVVANPARYAQSFLDLRRFLQQGVIEQIFLLNVFCSFGDDGYPAWQNDPKLAGGGVLLYNCYRIIDQILWNFSVPQQVYSLQTNRAQDKQQRLYLAEDTVVVTMKFTDSFIGNLVASRRSGIGPRREILQIYGKDKILTVNQSQLTISDGLGEICEQIEYDDDLVGCMTELSKNFALSILSPDNNKPCSTTRENLKNMAVMESAYLSARTGFPEEPARILQMPSGASGMMTGI
ncbi:MAG: Gfo/Idh/MocA family oxidoreductase [Sedimentisphaerales bacterium]|nr:Gfo/Idh/MocA family oxidoreductase [Sedimentisphaerales bacterium]